METRSDFIVTEIKHTTNYHCIAIREFLFIISKTINLTHLMYGCSQSYFTLKQLLKKFLNFVCHYTQIWPYMFV